MAPQFLRRCAHGCVFGAVCSAVVTHVLGVWMLSGGALQPVPTSLAGAAVSNEEAIARLTRAIDSPVNHKLDMCANTLSAWLTAGGRASGREYEAYVACQMDVAHLQEDWNTKHHHNVLDVLNPIEMPILPPPPPAQAPFGTAGTSSSPVLGAKSQPQALMSAKSVSALCPKVQRLRCETCKPGDPADGGVSPKGGRCIGFCSQHGYCGMGPNYDVPGATDCFDCRLIAGQEGARVAAEALAKTKVEAEEEAVAARAAAAPAVVAAAVDVNRSDTTEQTHAHTSASLAAKSAAATTNTSVLNSTRAAAAQPAIAAVDVAMDTSPSNATNAHANITSTGPTSSGDDKQLHQAVDTNRADIQEQTSALPSPSAVREAAFTVLPSTNTTVLGTTGVVANRTIDDHSVGLCPEQCYRCKPGDPADGGRDLFPPVGVVAKGPRRCVAFCSVNSYCGTGVHYANAQSTRCEGCNADKRRVPKLGELAAAGSPHGDFKPTPNTRDAEWLRSALQQRALLDHEKPMLLVAILSARGHARRRQLMRQALRLQSRSSQSQPFMTQTPGAARIVFIVGAGCTLPQQARKPLTILPDNRPLTSQQHAEWDNNPTLSRNEVICNFPANAKQTIKVQHPADGCWKIDWSQRCGESSCEVAPGKEHWPRVNLTSLPDSEELALLNEQTQYGDVFRVDSVDEYSRSAQKMVRFILEVSGGGKGTPPFRHFVKLDDDNLFDVGRVTCGLAKLHDDTKLIKMCMSAGLGNEPSPFKLPSMRTAFWWSSFRQHDIHVDPKLPYYVPLATALDQGAKRICFHAYDQSTRTAALLKPPPAWRASCATSRTGTGPCTRFFQPYGFGGSHLLSADVLQWWGAHPEAMPTSIWMEDAAFGVWFANYVQAHRDSAVLVNDNRWLYDARKACAGNTLGMNGGITPQISAAFMSGQLNRVWLDALADCGNGCGCSGFSMMSNVGSAPRRGTPRVLEPPTVLSAASCML